jgi:hypothetical protein
MLDAADEVVELKVVSLRLVNSLLDSEVVVVSLVDDVVGCGLVDVKELLDCDSVKDPVELQNRSVTVHRIIFS